MENITSAKQILAVVKDTGAKLIKLANPDGNIIVGGNTNKISIEKRANEMEKLLKSSFMPDGVYTLQIFQNTRSQPTNIRIYKGNPANTSNTETVTIAMSEGTKNEIALLNEKIEKLEKLLTENYLSDDDGEGEGKGNGEGEEEENKFSWIKDCVTAILPAIDKHFELSDRKLKLAERQFSDPSANTNLELTISMLQKIEDTDKAQQALLDIQKTDLNLYNQILNWYKQNQQVNSATNES